MNARLIITAGYRFTDIDAYACAVTYAEALRLSGQEAIAVLPGPLNASTPDDRDLPVVATDIATQDSDRYVLVDISDPRHVAPFVEINKVFEVFDHHPGFEAFWRSKTAAASRIEPIGAAATMIWERVLELGVQRALSGASAKAIAYAIASNTVGLSLPLTTDRDRYAMIDAAGRAGLSGEWMDSYFRGVDGRVQSDLWSCLRRDTKLAKLGNKHPVLVGQIELSNGRSIVTELSRSNSWSREGHGIVIITSRQENRTYVYSNICSVHAKLELYFSGNREGNVTTIDSIVLRKMLMPYIEEFTCMETPLRDRRV